MGQPSHTCFLKLDTFGHSAPTQAELVRFIAPLLDIIPGFQAKILSGGITVEGGGGGGGDGGGGGGGLATGVRAA